MDEARIYRQQPFYRIFAGQLILLGMLMAAAVWLWMWSGVSLVLVVIIFFAVLATMSIVGPAHAMAHEVITDQSAMRAKKYFGRSWLTPWDDVQCALVIEVPTFGARKRLKVVSRTSGALFVSDLIDNFDDLVAQVKSFAPNAEPCDRPGAIERWVIGG